MTAATAPPMPRLVTLATAVPPHVLHQQDVEARAAALFDQPGGGFARMRPIYQNAGIAKRHSCVAVDWYMRPAGWRERNDLYLEHALALMRQAATTCLARAALVPEQVDAIVTVSSTGIATPSLEARLMEQTPFRRDVVRLPIFGLGCAGGALGLARAAALARARPGMRVLLLVVELCGLTFRAADRSKGNIVASALFGDGAAAALISGDEADAGPAIGLAGEYTWPGSLDVMGWDVAEDGLAVQFSHDIPTILREHYPAALDGFLATAGLARRDLRAVALHPGGAKVIAALEEVFDTAPVGLDDARIVLREFGNMSAASVLFVLERVLARQVAGPHLISALGPGFTAGFLLLHP